MCTHIGSIETSTCNDAATLWGGSRRCGRFLLACELYYAEHPEITETQRISLLIQCFKGSAMDWAAVVWKAAGKLTRDYSTFLNQFWLVFDHPKHGMTSGQRLIQLHQGDASAATYSISFQVLVVESGWNEPALRAIFLNSL